MGLKSGAGLEVVKSGEDQTKIGKIDQSIDVFSRSIVTYILHMIMIVIVIFRPADSSIHIDSLHARRGGKVRCQGRERRLGGIHQWLRVFFRVLV